jgi:predicted MPP superfamily phosphohydrolase
MRDNFAFRDLGVVKVLHKGKITFTELKKIIKEYFSQIERSIPLKKQITWLHLSDLHIKSNDPVESYNRRIILNALFDDIRNQISQGWVPDFIIFSGDLAYKGKKEEYDLAVNSFLEPLIKVTGLTRDNLFFVPGNHDIDRSTINNIESAGMRALLYNPDKITEFLLDLNKLPFYFSKFESYGTFFNESFGPHIEFSGSSYYYSKSFNLRGIKIGIMGLNSSWMSGYSSNDRGKIKDEGNLLLGEVQLNMALENVADSDLKIAIMHHPIRCCHPEEQDRIWSLFKKNCDFIVHGHVHNSRIYAHYDPQNSVLIIPSGSLYGEEGRKSLNGYNIVRYDFDEKQCKIKLRRYSDMGMSGPQWVKDIESSGEENNGILSFSA